MAITRRQMLVSTAVSSTLIANSGTIPRFLLEASAALPKSNQKRVLVVLQMSGGNDGLNTIIPVGDDVYHRSRHQTRVKEGIKIDDYLHFHPALSGLADLWGQGQLCVVQGVGYPNPNRSHFESMDIWHSAGNVESNRQTGWLGRHLDLKRESALSTTLQAASGIHLGSERQPLALAGLHVHVPTMASIGEFQLRGLSDPYRHEIVEKLLEIPRPTENDLRRFVREAGETALRTSRQIRAKIGEYRTRVDYPSNDLATKLRTVAQLIAAGLETEIYYLILDGFDTHSEQSDAHAGLLRTLGEGLRAFLADLQSHHLDDRVLVMCFSEFGRRVEENASRGTDHGTAAPMFVAGGAIRGGLAGDHPRLDDLEDGDLKFHTDFREVYATILDGWLEVDSQAVLFRQFEPLGFLA